MSHSESTESGLLTRRKSLALPFMATAALAVDAGTAQAATVEPPKGDQLITLGTTAGPPVEPGRVGVGTVLLVNSTSYVIDCGWGTTQKFAESGLRFQSLGGIFLTHLHADHIMDYYKYFQCIGWQTKVTSTPGPGPFPPVAQQRVPVFGPGRAGGLPRSRVERSESHVGDWNPTPGTEDMTRDLHRAFAYSSNIFNRDAGINDIRDLVSAHDIRLPHRSGASWLNTSPDMEPFSVFEDKNVKVSAILVPHYDVFPSFAFRFDLADGRSVTFSGDTRKSDNVIRLARGSDVLVHECIFTLSSLYHQRSHTSAVEVGEVAKAAAVDHVIVSHYDPGDLPDEKWFAAIGKNFDGKISIAKDGQRFPL